MSLAPSATPEVYSTLEVARAAGVREAQVRALVAAGTVDAIGTSFLDARNAARAVVLLRTPRGRHELFSPAPGGSRSFAQGLAGSGAVHAMLLAVLALLAGMGAGTAASGTPEPMRLVFLMQPGPGGGGGGGGVRLPPPPARAALRGAAHARSPVRAPAVHRPPEPAPEPRPEPPPAPRPAPVEPAAQAPAPPAVPQPSAPVVSAPADRTDAAGILSDRRAAPAQGPGTGGGAGTGSGAGIGEGSGDGIGPGAGGGAGGGPYRPGTGITPPTIQREVRPDYTEEGRRLGLSGDVLLEIVVRSDGSVGDIRVLQGLGGGLDRRAVEAVRQWRFSPARRFGTPVDVLVEVAVEFKLR